VKRIGLMLGAFALLTTPATEAAAFCGFYVSGAGASLYNHGSLVVLMRDGSRTVVSMQNDYQGPPEGFALVVPVPEVLAEEQVRTLERDVFQKVDRLAAPRLVEYWEQDPCPEPAYYDRSELESVALADSGSDEPDGGDQEEPRDLGVRVEAEFAVAEYDVVILSAAHSAGLDAWLRQNDYRIPNGAERVLRAYVEQDMKFFVAKVDPARVTFDGESAILSPLRFHYDSEELFLPIRLGMLNSDGEQDLLVHVLARGMRFEVANYDNYAIPSNIVVSAAVREDFGAFYQALFTRMAEAHPRAVVTEYAWRAGSCDPCPEPPLDADAIVSLGADVIPTYERAIRDGRVQTGFENDFVLTRMHLRYGSEDSTGEDLYFRPAPAIEGGRGTPDPEGQLSVGVRGYSVNNFQARYAVLHAWEGAIECEQPRRGMWGGPPSTQQGSSQPIAAAGLAFGGGGGGASLEQLLGAMPQLGLDTDTLPQGEVTAPPPPELPPGGGCARCGAGGSASVSGVVVAFAWIAVFLRRRRR